MSTALQKKKSSQLVELDSSLPIRFLENEGREFATTDTESQILPSHRPSSVLNSTFPKTDFLTAPISAANEPAAVVTPLVRLSRPSKIRRVDVLQQFEGIVTEFGKDYFIAKMHDLTNASNAVEIMEFDIRELTKEDQSILREGSVIYWTMGYETRDSGQIVRISEMRVQRNPIWTKAKFESANRNAKVLFTLADE